MVAWNCERELVDLIVERQFAGCCSVLDAVLVLQHCSVHEISLLDFVREWRVFAGRMLPCEDVAVTAVEKWAAGPAAEPAEAAVAVPVVPPAAAPAEGPAEAVRWLFSEWRAEPVSSNRLYKLECHIAEVMAAGGNHETYLKMLRQYESQLARVVKKPGVLPLVADDEPEAAAPPEDAAADVAAADGAADGNGEPDADPVAALAPAPPAEQAEIAAVLANPAAAAAAGSAPEPAASRDQLGRELVAPAVLDELIQLGGRLGMNRVECTEMLCTKFKLRRPEDLQASVAKAVIENMRAKIGSAEKPAAGV